MDDFIEDFYAVDGFADTDYFGSLKRYGIDTESGIDSCDVDHADLELMRLALHGACAETASATVASRHMPRAASWTAALSA